MAIYLDHQASTPLSPAVQSAMMPFFSDFHANPHSDDHAAGWSASSAVERARGEIADAIGADANEIIFTSGATEANNLALLGVAAARSSRCRIIVSAIEHKSVLGPARALARAGHDVVVLPVGADGLIDLALLEKTIEQPTTLVSIGAVNNEVGTVQSIGEIARLCQAAGALLHTDATQALSWDAADVAAWGVDFASFSSHKIRGPKGIGALYVANGARGRLSPLQHGGEQEGGLRPGTLPTFLCVGFGAACLNLPDSSAVGHWRQLTSVLLDELRTVFPNLRLNGTEAKRHPGNLNVSIPGVEADRLLALVQPHLAISRGSACTSGIPEPSHVLAALGLPMDDMNSSLRLSTGVDTTASEVREAVQMLQRALSRVEAA